MDFFTFVIAMTAILGGLAFIIILAVAFLRLVSRKRDSGLLSEEEGRMLQELWAGLQKMEERIANLETILMHKERS